MRGWIALIFVLTAHAQKFEVATIKPCRPAGPAVAIPPTPGHLTVNCISVSNLIQGAYVLFENGTMNPPGRTVPVEKGPAWIETDLYTIEARAESAADQGTMHGPMLRALLEDRFRLKLHTETREVPVYLLTAARAGSKLTSAAPESCADMDLDHAPAQPLRLTCRFARVTLRGFELRGATMPDFAQAIAGRLNRDVIDRTGITGLFDFDFAMFPDASGAGLGPPPTAVGLPPPPPAPPPPPPEPGSASDPGGPFGAAQAALQKFGLRLESARGPARVLVIDRVERPSEN